MKPKDWVALILALAITVSVNVFAIAVLYDAIASEGPGLSSNAVQVLTLAFGGIIGLLGGYFGYKAGASSAGPPVGPPPRRPPAANSVAAPATDSEGGEPD